MAASPLEPAGGVAGRLGPAERVGEEAPGLGDGKRDKARVGGWRVTWPGWRRGLGAGAVLEHRCGDGADREDGHDQHEVAQDRGVEPGLALVQPDAALSGLEGLLSRPPLMPM